MSGVESSRSSSERNYLGLSVEEFKQIYQGEWRIEKEDSDTHRLEADYNPGRVNLTIVSGVILSIAYF